jgi:GDP-L-fucose synthase
MLFKDKRVLVAGATGLIGSHLTRRLLAEGARVRATHLKRDVPIKHASLETMRVDLTRGEDCRNAVRDMEWVFLCAASTSGAHTIANTPMVHVTPNVLINSQMLEACYEADVAKFQWLSSTVAYPPSDQPMREEQMFEGEPFEKYYFAGWTKRFTEILCRMYGEKLARKMTTIVLRPTNVYGPGDDFEFATSHVIPALMRKIVERWNPLEVWGDGSEVRDAIYVDDMVEAMLLAMRKLDRYDAINVGLGRGYSVNEILKELLELDGFKDAKIVYDKSKPTMIPIRLISTEKAERVLGFKAKVSLREGLQRTLEWYRKQR